MNLADIRLDYGLKGLSPEQCHVDPYGQLQQWLDEAIEAGVPDATAMHLATVDSNARPSGRIVLLKGIADGAVHFYTNYDSRKGHQLAANPYASSTFFWPELERQVRIEGRAEKLRASDSDAYFASRPYGSQIGAWVSAQSQALEAPELLLERERELKAKYPTEVPRPPHWGGYRLVADHVEFWQGRPSRLHDRVLYLPSGDGAWHRSRLQP
ncbi:pyridoxamine 5'-phosphate oxidase [Paraperlucidibaca wandonensis]|uniref:Pyridoxine/pyridoxamine 5'-phosphate oxidase n=1 Tax=Paraperlucidibaca wandonensis TaxID=1268273 RepID=A0ABW3HFV0_9GAMM